MLFYADVAALINSSHCFRHTQKPKSRREQGWALGWETLWLENWMKTRSHGLLTLCEIIKMLLGKWEIKWDFLLGRKQHREGGWSVGKLWGRESRQANQEGMRRPGESENKVNWRIWENLAGRIERTCRFSSLWVRSRNQGKGRHSH